MRLKVETTNICNANCLFCSYSRSTRPKGTMSSSLFEKVVSQYSEMGGGELTVSPVIGDTLLDRKLLSRLRYCRKLRNMFNIRIWTNLVALNLYSDTELKELLSLIDKWGCSVPANAAIGMSIMKVNFDVVVNHLKRLVELKGRSYCSFNVTGVGINAAFTPDPLMLDLSTKLNGGPVFWKRSSFNWPGGNVVPNGIWTVPPELARVACKKADHPVVFFDGKVGLCSCADYDAELLIGDMNEQSLVHILQGDRRKQLLEKAQSKFMKDLPVTCKTCSFNLAEEGFQLGLTWDMVKSWSDIKLYAGDIPLWRNDDVVGLSISKSDWRHIKHNVKDSIPLPPNSITRYEAESVFEYVSYSLLPGIIDDIFKVLKPGGLLRMSVPDYRFDIYRARAMKNKRGRIESDKGALWFPIIESVTALISKTKFASTVNYLEFYMKSGKPLFLPIDYSFGFIKRTSTNDERVKRNPRPVSIVVDMWKPA